MRITWFGNRCFRIKFSTYDFVFFPDEAVAIVSKNELVDMATAINSEVNAPFKALADDKPIVSGGRLIDVMDDPESYLTNGDDFILDALPDERLVIRFLGRSRASLADAWLNQAVVLCAGSAAQCLSALDDLHSARVRQVLFAVSDIENLNMDELIKTAGTLRLQLMEFSFAIEL